VLSLNNFKVKTEQFDVIEMLQSQIWETLCETSQGTNSLD